MGRTACTEPQCLYKGALYLYLYPKTETAMAPTQPSQQGVTGGGGGLGWGYKAELLHPPNIKVRNEWSLTATHSWHAQALYIILCGISKAKAWRMFYQELCFWMHSSNSAVCQQMSLRLRSYLKAHIFRLFAGPRNEHQFCAADQWTPPINIAYIRQTGAQVADLTFIPFHISALGMFCSNT